MPIASCWSRKLLRTLHLTIIVTVIVLVLMILSPNQMYSLPLCIWRDNSPHYSEAWTSDLGPRGPMSVYCKCGITPALTTTAAAATTTTTEKIAPPLLYSTTAISQKIHVNRNTHDWINEKRKELVYNECQNYPSKSGVLRGVYLHENTKLAYCPIAKAGCTFWKRIFLFLHNETGQYHTNTPLQIPRMFVHYGKMVRTKIIKAAIEDGTTLANFYRFLFVRDPYARVWSTYLDKFYLPDFWSTHALRITSRRGNVTRNRNICQNDITFKEFLEYVLSSPPNTLNEHWQPVKYRCDPCKFKPNFIGKLETFGNDARYILQQIGLDWVMDDLDHKTVVKEELKMLIDYNFGLLKRRLLRQCLTYSDVARRLLHVFHLNGYIPINNSIMGNFINIRTKTDIQKFKSYVVDLYDNVSSKERNAMKFQRRQSIKEAYRQIPLSIIKRITNMFRSDFVTFGYDMVPPSFKLTV